MLDTWHATAQQRPNFQICQLIIRNAAINVYSNEIADSCISYKSTQVYCQKINRINVTKKNVATYLCISCSIIAIAFLAFKFPEIRSIFVFVCYDIMWLR